MMKLRCPQEGRLEGHLRYFIQLHTGSLKRGQPGEKYNLIAKVAIKEISFFLQRLPATKGKLNSHIEKGCSRSCPRIFMAIDVYLYDCVEIIVGRVDCLFP